MTDTADADLVIVNGRLWSPGYSKPKRLAVALGRGRIVRVGSNERCEAEAARTALVLDVGGCLVLPGFVDAHAHLLHTGPRMGWLQLQEIPSLQRLLAVVSREAKKTRPGKWLLGRAWDESKWPERRFPTRDELDRSAGRMPTFLRRIDGHMAVVNTAGMGALKIPRGTKGYETDSVGRPTGVVRENALDLASERLSPSVEELVDSYVIMQRIAHSQGITSIHDVVDECDIEAYQRLHRARALGLRVSMMPLFKLLPKMRRFSHQNDEWLRFGALKAFADGSLGARSAALHEPYADDKEERGMLPHRSDVLKSMVRKTHRQGLQLAFHAIGDRAIDSVLDAYEDVLDEWPRDDHRHRIEHFELPTDDALGRCLDLGIIPVMQPNFVMEWGLPGGMYESRLGARRGRRINPHRLVLSRGLRLAFGSDGMPYGPIYGLKGAVCPPYPNQRIPLEKALTAYTVGGAFASFEENIKGALVPGMLADLAVIEGSWSGGDLEGWKVAATIVGGKIAYETRAFKQAHV